MNYLTKNGAGAVLVLLVSSAISHAKDTNKPLTIQKRVYSSAIWYSPGSR